MTQTSASIIASPAISYASDFARFSPWISSCSPFGVRCTCSTRTMTPISCSTSGVAWSTFSR